MLTRLGEFSRCEHMLDNMTMIMEVRGEAIIVHKLATTGQGP